MLDPGSRARQESGASSVEYGLIAVAIAALIVVVVFALGNVVRSTYGESCETIRDNAAPASEEDCATE